MDFSYFTSYRCGNVEPPDYSWDCNFSTVSSVVFEEVGVWENLNEISKKIF